MLDNKQIEASFKALIPKIDSMATELSGQYPNVMDEEEITQTGYMLALKYLTTSDSKQYYHMRTHARIHVV